MTEPDPNKAARRKVARYFRAFGLRDSAVVRSVLRRFEAHIERRSRDDEEYEPEPLVVLAVERVEEWIDGLCDMLGIVDRRETMRGFVLEEIAVALADHPAWFLRKPDELLARLRAAVDRAATMFPHDDQPLEMVPHKLSELPGLLREETWRQFLREDLPSGAPFRRRRRARPPK